METGRLSEPEQPIDEDWGSNMRPSLRRQGRRSPTKTISNYLWPGHAETYMHV